MAKYAFDQFKPNEPRWKPCKSLNILWSQVKVMENPVNRKKTKQISLKLGRKPLLNSETQFKPSLNPVKPSKTQQNPAKARKTQ